MNLVDDEVDEQPCTNHPSTLTVVCCGKCGVHICPRCMVFAPVGVRCRGCAQLRRPAQFDVPASRLAAAGGASLAVAFVAWLIALQVFFFAWLMAIGLGLAVGEVASRVAKRRVSRSLEVAVGGAIVLAFLLGRWVQFLSHPGVGLGHTRDVLNAIAGTSDPFALIMVVLAVIFAVARLRR